MSQILAGMPSVQLTDIAQLRLQSISFFLLVLLLSAWAIQRIWNLIRKDFPRLPRLGYGRALAVVGLWGFLFLLILTMISGARELLTPGAWEKQGLTYRLKGSDNADSLRSPSMDERRAKLVVLHTFLRAYADANEGVYPRSEHDDSVPAVAWESADVTREPFVYRVGGSTVLADFVVAYEPASFQQPRLALMGNGDIRVLSDRELQELISPRRVAAE